METFSEIVILIGIRRKRIPPPPKRRGYPPLEIMKQPILVPGERDYIQEAKDAFFQSIRQEGESDLDTRKRFFAEMKTEQPWMLVIHQDILRRLFAKIRDVCTRENIAFWLMGGSAIGAIRHHGLIPWDTDGDIGMMRSDFNRFVKACVADPELLFGYSARDVGLYGKISFSEFKDSPVQPHLDIFVFDWIPVTDDDMAHAYWEQVWIPTRKKVQEALRNAPTPQQKLIDAEKALDNYPLFGDGPYLIWDVAGYESSAVVQERVYRKEEVFPLETLKFEGMDMPVAHDYEATPEGSTGTSGRFPVPRTSAPQ